MAASIKDIAQRLNISVSTVSYALNDGPKPVRQDLKSQILAVAQELEYRPSRVARSMVTGRSQAIGVVPPGLIDDAFLSPFLQLAVNGMANEAARLHQDLLLFTRYRDTAYEELLSTILDGRIDGVIFVAPFVSESTLELLGNLRLPCAIIAGTAVEGVVTLRVNNDNGMKLVLQHLYDLGHRKIAHIAGRLHMDDTLTRMKAYQTFIREKKITYNDDYVVVGRFLIEGGRKAMHELMSLPNPPSAVACANDEMAIGAVLAAHEMGLRVPEDVSITGFDMTPSTEHVFPAITTIKLPIGRMGEAAVRAVINLIDGNEVSHETVFESELLVRASTTIPKEDSHE